MNRRSTVASLLLLAAGVLAAEAEGNEPACGVCLGVVTGRSEKLLTSESKPEKDACIVAHARTGRSCYLLLFALSTPGGKLANGWPLQFVELQASNEAILLPESGVWKWPADSGPFDVYAVFLQQNSREYKEVKTLVTAILNPAGNKDVSSKQAAKLRELITGFRPESKPVPIIPKKTPESAVVYRSSEFPWKKNMHEVMFSGKRPVLLIFRIGDKWADHRDSGPAR